MKRNPFSVRRIILMLLLCFISISIMAQKINLDTLTVDDLNLYMHKAVTMRNVGKILTFSGVGIVAAGYITSLIWMSSNSLEGWEAFKTLVPFALGALVGIPTSIVGISLWAIGGSRKTKAELTLQKFDIIPKNSMALGLGVTLRF